MKQIILLLMLLASFPTQALTYTKEFSEAELQAQIEAMMPLVKTKYFITIEISNPILDLVALTNELSISADVAALANGSTLGKGSLQLKGTLRYDPDQGAFYLNNATIVKMTIEGVAEQYQKSIKQLSQVAVTEALQQVPVYQFNEGLKQQFAKSVLKSVQVKDEKLLIELSLL
ncbi:MAG: hypothetical protein COB04_14910 [Gammaproteobacteria bacterium]|nr:MAG: hypothetical protein COB04_14910 [Gammaproteobacteria bacterium]